MSRRITTKTQITDKALAIQALDQAAIHHEVRGDTIRMTSQPYSGATLNLKTGDISGDEDYHRTADLGVLRQYYGEAQVRATCLKEGTMIESREVDEEENVILMWHTA